MTASCGPGTDDPVEGCVATMRAQEAWHDQCVTDLPMARSDDTLRAICEARLAANGVTFSVAATNDCRASSDSAKGDCHFHSTASCVDTGTLSNGTPCAVGAQCASGYCDVPPQTACGTCADAPVPLATVGLNGACDAAHPCDWKYWCDSSGQCRNRVGEGAACVASFPGNPTFNGKSSQTGNCDSLHLACDVVCKRRPGEGSTCLTDAANNVLPSCDVGLYCDQSLKCVKEFNFVSAGSTCPGASQPVTCESGTACSNGVCKKLGTVGEPCPCETGLSCLSSVCAAPSYSCP